MVFQKTILLLIALHIHVFSFSHDACNSVFTGQIRDDSNQPVIGAGVLLMPGQSGGLSDAEGKFRFENLCPGKYEVRIQYLGYEDIVLHIDVNGIVNRVITLKELPTVLHEVVIEHHDADNTEHANNFVQLNEKQLEESAGKSLGESLRDLSGVSTIQTGPGIFKPVIHGVHGQRVLILNSGVVQEGQDWGADHAPEIDPFIASNIVVIKDASAIKYGNGALGGVIVLNPPELPDQPGLAGTFNSVFQSNGRSATVSGLLEGGVAGHEGWGWRLQGTGKRTGDFNTSSYILSNTGIRELNFSASGGYHKPTKGFDVFFSHFHSDLGILRGTAIGNQDDLAAAMEREEPEYTSGFSYNIAAPYQDVSHNLLKLNSHFKTQHGEWRFQYGFQNNNRKEFDQRIGELSKTPSIDLQLNTHTIEGEWETVHSKKRTVSIGVNASLQNNRNIFGTRRIPFLPNFTNLSSGLFGVAKLYMHNWVLDFGARYDYLHYAVSGFDFKNSLYRTSLEFHNPSTTTGATVHLSEHHTVNLNVSTAWRPPHVAELYSLGTHQSAAAIEYGLLLNDSTNEVMDIHDVNFKTEKAIKTVVTYKGEWDNFSVEIGPYVNEIFNYIYLRPLGITKNVRGVYPYFRYTQTNALFLGTDITGTWKIREDFSVSTRASLLRASDQRNNDYLIFIPSNNYEAILRYERPVNSVFRNFYIESKTRYTAKQSRAPRVVTVREIKDAEEQNKDPFGDDQSIFDFMAPPKGYWLWDVSAGVSVKSKRTQYDIRLSSENTLNEQYREYTNRFRYYADDLGRNIILSLKCIF
jgi:iron complex outermembrane receptor protein